MLCKVVKTNCENTVIDYNGTLVQLPIKNCTEKEIEYGEVSKETKKEDTAKSVSYKKKN